MKYLCTFELINKKLMTEEEKEMVYKMCRVLGLVFEVWRDGVLVGVFKYVDDKIIKLKTE